MQIRQLIDGWRRGGEEGPSGGGGGGGGANATADGGCAESAGFRSELGLKVAMNTLTF